MKPLFTDFNCDAWFVLLMLIKEVCITWRARSVSDVHLAVGPSAGTAPLTTLMVQESAQSQDLH